jgi:hypothetical protein
MAFDDTDALAGLIDAAAEQGPDMNEAVAGGGGQRELPAEGYVRLRLVSYIEIGVHMDKVQGQEKKKEMVILEFECSGPKHPNRESDDKPHIVQVKLSKSLNEKAHYFKLFKRLNHTGQYRHFAQLIGKAFVGTIVHNTSGEGDKARTYANLRNADGYTVRPAFREDEEGESIPVKVDPAKTAVKLFMWDAPKGLKDMWDSLFIDGTYEVKGKDGEEPKSFSKNFFQDTIRKALNFKGSPIAALVEAGGEEPDLGEGAERPDREEDPAPNSDDPLAGM